VRFRSVAFFFFFFEISLILMMDLFPLPGSLFLWLADVAVVAAVVAVVVVVAVVAVVAVVVVVDIFEGTLWMETDLFLAVVACEEILMDLVVP